MGKTIIQTIGPLYGEVVNGTVFGRPNGSIYIPSSNTITASLPADQQYIKVSQYGYGDRITCCTSDGTVSASSVITVIAESQDVQSYIGISVVDSDDAEVGTPRYLSAGTFNVTYPYLANAGEGVTIENGADYVVVVSLFSASGVPIATARIPVKGVSE